MKTNEIDTLVSNLNPRAKLPHGFGLWSEKMQLMWLQQNQRKSKESKHEKQRDPVKADLG